MAITKFLTKVITSLTLEKIVRFAGRRTADVVYYSVPVFRDPKIIISVAAVSKASQIAAKKYKRVNFDPVQIFEDSVDAVTDAY